MQSGQEEEHVFVVRVRKEPGSSESTGCRGFVEHVASGRRMYFSNLGNLNDFISLRVQTKCQAK